MYFSEMYVLVVPNEWQVLEERIGADHTITVTFTDGQVTTNPGK
jgi:hypothetical protein